MSPVPIIGSNASATSSGGASSAQARQGVTQKMRQMVSDVINSLHVPRIVYGQVSASSTSSPTVSVTLQGTGTVISGVKYPESLNPIVGETVVCARVGTDMFILTRIATTLTPWVAFGSAGAVGLASPWSAFGSGYTAPGYRRLGDMVQLRGTVSSSGATGALAPITNRFPSVYVAAGNTTFGAYTNAGVLELYVLTSGGNPGQLLLGAATSGPTTVLLDGLWWTVAP